MIEQQSIFLQQAKMNKNLECCYQNRRMGCLGRTARVNGDCGHRVHVRLGDVFDCYRDVEIPGADRLIIRRSDKPPILIHESDRVDGPQMLIIFLCYFPRPDVVLGGVSCHTYRG